MTIVDLSADLKTHFAQSVPLDLALSAILNSGCAYYCHLCFARLLITDTQLFQALFIFVMSIMDQEVHVLSQMTLNVDNNNIVYSLVRAIYLGNEHFTVRIIDSNSNVWFHDGITTGRTTTYEGNLVNKPFNFLNNASG
jgi:hypothetical protein